MTYGNPSIADALERLRRDERAATAGAADVSAVLGHHHRVDLRARHGRAVALALDPRAAHGQPVLGRGRLHRRARRQHRRALAAARAQAPAVLVPLDPEALLPRRRPVPLLLPRHGTARRRAARPRRRASGRSASSRASAARNGSSRTSDLLLQDYAQRGPKRVTLVCPGFATDCLETLEEIDMQNREAFLAHGGEAFDYVPCLNSSPPHVDALRADRAAARAGLAGDRGTRRLGRRCAQSRERALALGARRPEAQRARALPRDQRPRAGRPGLARVLRIARLRAGGDGRRLDHTLRRGHRRPPVPRPARA